VSYDSDLDAVTRTALESIRGIAGLLDAPAPQVLFQEFQDSAIAFQLYFWVDTEKASPLDAQDAGLKALKRAFQEARIEMPYPTVQVVSVPAAGLLAS
jgi:small conductance mechanosensitive channel